jgi:formyl-CoA transferase
MEQPELASDERYSTHSARGRTMTELDTLIATWTTTLTADDLLAKLHAGGVPAGRIFRAKDMFTDPHFAAREAIVRVMHPELGELPMQNVAPRLSRTPGKVRTAGPALGEHNREIWHGLIGLTDGEIADYSNKSVI